jgi:hypothetical protein
MQSLLSQYKELEGKPICTIPMQHFTKILKKMGLTNGLNRMRLADNTKGAFCATCLVSQHKGSWFRRAAKLVLISL